MPSHPRRRNEFEIDMFLSEPFSRLDELFDDDLHFTFGLAS